MTIDPSGRAREYCRACRIGIHPSARHAPFGRVGARGRSRPGDNAGKRPRRGGSVGRIVIIGGGPAGYEAALVAAQLDAEVTIVETDGAGGACVLSDCVPSKTFIASSDVVTAFHHGDTLGVRVTAPDAVTLDAPAVHARVKRLALAQSADIAAKLGKAGVELVHGRARLGADALGHLHQVVVSPTD